MSEQVGSPSAGSPTASISTPTSNSRNHRSHFHAAARLQLAAALLEYDYDQDGKLAEQSAIFAPYRQEPDYTSSSTLAAAVVHPYAGHESPVPSDAGADHYQDYRIETTRSIVNNAAATGNFQGYTRDLSPKVQDDSLSRKSFDFLPPKSDSGLASSPNPSDTKTTARPATTLAIYDEPEVNDDELASEWGLDNVVSKFEKLDSNAFRMEASKMKAAAAAAAAAGTVASSSPATIAKCKNKAKGRKRSGTSGSDILLHLPDTTFTADLLNRTTNHEGYEEEEEELDHTLGMDAHSAPTVLDLDMKMNKRKLRHRSGSELKAARKSFESELEMAFSANSGEVDDLATSDNGYGGGRSRSSSLGAFNNENFTSPEIAKSAAIRAIAHYTAEGVARPASRLSIRGTRSNDGYVSRFDPKAIAAQREEELSTRPRFPTALHPKILIMPAPLAELEAEEKARKEKEEDNTNKLVNDKPRIEREAGKLYGKSLMDELQIRKERQKSRNRAFRGDSRVAMMDMKQFQIKTPSPLSTPNQVDQSFNAARAEALGKGEDIQDANKEDDDDDDKPLRPPGSSAPISDDPWIKYTSHRSLANVAKGKSTIEISKIAKDGINPSTASPALTSPDKRKSISPGVDTHRHTLSTAELQQQYKKNRQSMPALDQHTNEGKAEASEDDEDDDIPLGTRQEQLTSSQNQKPISPESPLTPVQQSQNITTKLKPKELQSVFGVDLIMQKELAKLEEILKIEEAERKMKLERERIKNAEKLAKEAKKRAKVEKKEKKRKLKEKAKNSVTGKDKYNKDSTKIENVDADMNMQWRTNENRASMMPFAGDVPMRSPSLQWQDDYQRQSYYSRRADGEVDDFFGGANDHRQSLLPHEMEEGALTPRPVHTRSSSFAPSLTLPFLAGDGHTEESSNNPSATGWFASEKDKKDNDSDNGEGSDKEERVRCKSPFGIDNFASDDEERMDVTAIWAEGDAEKQNSNMKEVRYDPSKKPELKRMSVAASFAGVLEGFGIGESGVNGSDEEDNKENRKSSQLTRRLSIHREDSSDSEEDAGRPLSAILLGNTRRSQAFHSKTGASSSARVAFEPPRLDLPTDFAIATKEDSDSEAEDEAPLALKRLNASLTAGTQGRTFDTEENGDDVDSEEDDLPLAVKQDDDKPLGQAHPVAALSQQMELQQQQNAALIAHMQLQYQYALQMQLQQAIIQQADIQGYTASQLNYVQPSEALSGAASDIGLDLGPDPKLVNSVDRWRQGVE